MYKANEPTPHKPSQLFREPAGYPPPNIPKKNYSPLKNLGTMVIISNYHLRERKDGTRFITLELQGEVELIQSSQTGKFYATAKRCTIPSTFNEETARNLIGKQFPGRIDRVQTEEYEFTLKETGEVIRLCHSYVYNPEETSLSQSAASRKLVV